MGEVRGIAEKRQQRDRFRVLAAYEEANVPTEKWNDVIVRSAREYPTEWTCYPAEEEEEKPQHESDDRAPKVDKSPDYIAGYWL